MSLNSCSKVAYVVSGTHFYALRARGAKISKKKFSDSQIESQMLSNEVSHARLRALLSKRSLSLNLLLYRYIRTSHDYYMKLTSIEIIS